MSLRSLSRGARRGRRTSRPWDLSAVFHRFLPNLSFINSRIPLSIWCQESLQSKLGAERIEALEISELIAMNLDLPDYLRFRVTSRLCCYIIPSVWNSIIIDNTHFSTAAGVLNCLIGLCIHNLIFQSSFHSALDLSSYFTRCMKQGSGINALFTIC